MLKVLLVDDEKWVRTTIKSVLPLEKSELVLVGEASNGIEALALALQMSPDILITDIKMPGLTGIELIAKLKEPLPHLKAIIISGYDEFDFAKKALQLGAVDYLLKPVDAENVSIVLARVKKLIFEEQERLAQERYLKTHYQLSLPLLREKFLNSLIKQEHLSRSEIERQAESLKLNLKNNYFVLMAITIDDYASKSKKTAPDHSPVILKKFAVLCRRVAKKYFQGSAFLNNQVENELMILANPEHPFTAEYTHAILANLNTMIIRRFNITFSAGISSNKMGLPYLNILYEEAAHALKYKLLYGKGSIIFFEEVKHLKISELSFSKDIIDEIVLNMELFNESNLATIMNHLFAQIKSHQETTPESMKTSLWRLITDILTTLNCAAFPTGKLYEIGDASPYEVFKSLETLTDIHEFLINLLRFIMNEHLKKEKPDSQSVIEIAKHYIDHHFHKEITLELMANYVFINPSYFSELFKKEIGQNFIEYITNLRIHKAKELLCNSNMKVYEICQAVGYEDSKYFSKIFKRIVGMTPSEYKNQQEPKS